MVFTKMYAADIVILTVVMETGDVTGDAKQQKYPTVQGINTVITHHTLVHKYLIIVTFSNTCVHN